MEPLFEITFACPLKFQSSVQCSCGRYPRGGTIDHNIESFCVVVSRSSQLWVAIWLLQALSQRKNEGTGGGSVSSMCKIYVCRFLNVAVFILVKLVSGFLALDVD